VKKARVEHLYAMADREIQPEPGEPGVIFCMRQWVPAQVRVHQLELAMRRFRRLLL